MDDPDLPGRRRAQVPAEWISPSRVEELPHRIAELFRADWELLVTESATCEALTLRSVGAFQRGAEVFDVPRALFLGPKSGGDPIRLALFAGLGGNDALARQALVGFLLELCRNPSLAKGMELYCYPVPDPGSAELKGTAPAGVHLAREFWSGSENPAVYFLERELGVFRFHGVVVLGSIPRSGSLGIHIDSPVLRPVLNRALTEASERILGERRAEEESSGICVGDAAATLVDSPELPTRAFGLTLCLPSQADHGRVCDSVSAVLTALLGRYGTLMALGQGI